MIICHIWDADYPWDVRVEKVCDSLAKKHVIHLVCRNSKRRPSYEQANHLHIHRLPALSQWWGKLNHFIGFPAFCNPLWIYHIWRTIRKVKADVIIVRDLPLALTAIGSGCLLGIPVVIDMAENYPAMIQDLWERDGFSVLNLVVRNPQIIRLVEYLSLRWCDHILVVVEESRDRLLRDGVPARKISLVRNTPTSARWEEVPSSHDSAVTRVPNSLVLVYLGLLEWPRGIETAIRAMPIIRERIPCVQLVIVGTGRHENDFKRLVAELHLLKHITFLGWLDYVSAIRVILESDIGLVPHHATESWNTTIPNKLFDYMSMGKPVIVSNAQPTERIVEEERCGLVFSDRDFDGFARAVLKLEQASTREEMGRNGKAAITERYNWAVDELRLFQALDQVAIGRKR